MKRKYHIAKPVQHEVEILPERDISRSRGRDVTAADLPALSEVSEKMQRAMSGANGVFAGPFPNAYALAHHQVERDHLRAFFIRYDIAAMYFDGHLMLLNPSWQPVGEDAQERREGCMTHNHRPERKVRRLIEIRAEFDTAENGALTHHVKNLTHMTAQIFQHETEHCDGKTIYSDKL